MLYNDKLLTKIKLRRGTDEKRKNVVFEDGECVYITDKERVYVGADLVKGGYTSSSKNQAMSGAAVLATSSENDIIVDKIDHSTYIIDDNNSLYKMMNVLGCCANLQKQIDEISSKIDKIKECCDPSKLLARDAATNEEEDLIKTDKNAFIRVVN